jgi:tRNA(adenine34) deaminase
VTSKKHGVAEDVSRAATEKIMPEIATDLDKSMMTRCLALSRESVAAGELPFACVISYDGEVVAESTNRVVRDRDVSRHAEMIAISDAQRALSAKRLSRCTLYSNVEPCAMCSYCIRETRIRKVVYAIRSPIMGGHSKWKILQDAQISRIIPEVFGKAPEVSGAVMREEAEAIWRDWNPLFWKVIRLRGCFGGVFLEHAVAEAEMPPRPGFWRRLMLATR